MVKHLKILDYALSSIVRRKYKSLSIITAFTFVVTALASVLLFSNSLKLEASYLLESAPDLIVQRMIGGRHDFIPVEYAEKIKEIRGIGEVNFRYWGYYYDALTNANYTILGADSSMETLKLLDGRLPANSSECAVGSGVAELRNTAPRWRAHSC